MSLLDLLCEEQKTASAYNNYKINFGSFNRISTKISLFEIVMLFLYTFYNKYASNNFQPYIILRPLCDKKKNCVAPSVIS